MHKRDVSQGKARQEPSRHPHALASMPWPGCPWSPLPMSAGWTHPALELSWTAYSLHTPTFSPDIARGQASLCHDLSVCKPAASHSSASSSRKRPDLQHFFLVGLPSCVPVNPQLSHQGQTSAHLFQGLQDPPVCSSPPLWCFRHATPQGLCTCRSHL